MFYKTSSIPLLGVYVSSGKFSKCAAKNDDINDSLDDKVKQSINLISKDLVKSLSKAYNISDNVNDYIFPVARAVTANIPNGNGDRFTHQELTRFAADQKCQVYETFKNVPFHVEHVAQDPKAARGFLPDVHYVASNPKDMYVLAVVAVDTKKDSMLAKGILSGQLNKFSMGCTCEAVRCSYSKCAKPVAYSDHELCSHLRHHMMSKIDGELIYEDCMGVVFEELSNVGIPADASALTQNILQIKANRRHTASLNRPSVISQLVNREDQAIIAKYLKANMNSIPEAMINLINKLF
jgi:hypothetical protein